MVTSSDPAQQCKVYELGMIKVAFEAQSLPESTQWVRYCRVIELYKQGGAQHARIHLHFRGTSLVPKPAAPPMLQARFAEEHKTQQGLLALAADTVKLDCGGAGGAQRKGVAVAVPMPRLAAAQQRFYESRGRLQIDDFGRALATTQPFAKFV